MVSKRNGVSNLRIAFSITIFGVSRRLLPAPSPLLGSLIGNERALPHFNHARTFTRLEKFVEKRARNAVLAAEFRDRVNGLNRNDAGARGL